MVVAKGWGKRRWKVMFDGGRVAVWEDGKFWSWVVAAAAQQREGTQCRCTAHLKMFKIVNFMLCVFYHNNFCTLTNILHGS